MPRWMVGIGLLGIVVLLAGGHVRMAGGFALGAALGVLGYFWLHQAVEALLDANPRRVPRSVVLKITLRYALMLGGILFFSRTGWLPVLPIFGGLLVPAGGVLIESLRLLGEGLRHTDPV